MTITRVARIADHAKAAASERASLVRWALGRAPPVRATTAPDAAAARAR